MRAGHILKSRQESRRLLRYFSRSHTTITRTTLPPTSGGVIGGLKFSCALEYFKNSRM